MKKATLFIILLMITSIGFSQEKKELDATGTWCDTLSRKTLVSNTDTLESIWMLKDVVVIMKCNHYKRVVAEDTTKVQNEPLNYMVSKVEHQDLFDSLVSAAVLKKISKQVWERIIEDQVLH